MEQNQSNLLFWGQMYFHVSDFPWFVFDSSDSVAAAAGGGVDHDKVIFCNLYWAVPHWAWQSMPQPPHNRPSAQTLSFGTSWTHWQWKTQNKNHFDIFEVCEQKLSFFYMYRR